MRQHKVQVRGKKERKKRGSINSKENEGGEGRDREQDEEET